MPSVKAKKRLGQNFLEDSVVIDKIVQQIIAEKPNTLLEIGAGTGALTTKIASLCKQLHCIEIDKSLYNKLSAQFNNAYPNITNIKLHNADALNFDFSAIDCTHIFGNLPYNVASQIIARLVSEKHTANTLTFMVQTEMALRFCAQPTEKNWGRLSMLANYNWQVQYLFDIYPESFNPQPKVMSTLIRFDRKQPQRDLANIPKLQAIAKQLFQQPRKTIANNLKALYTTNSLLAADIDPKSRPAMCSLEQILKLLDIT